MNIEKEMLKNQIISNTKTSHLLHMLLIVFFGIGLVTWPLAILMNNHKRSSSLRKLKKAKE